MPDTLATYQVRYLLAETFELSQASKSIPRVPGLVPNQLLVKEITVIEIDEDGKEWFGYPNCKISLVNHPSDEDLSLGTPVSNIPRIWSLLMR